MDVIFFAIFQTSTDVTNWPTLNETPRSNPTPTSANPKSKNNTTPKSEVETSSVNGEISKTENESSQGEQAPDGSKENQQNSSRNKKKKGMNLFFFVKKKLQIFLVSIFDKLTKIF